MDKTVQRELICRLKDVLLVLLLAAICLLAVVGCSQNRTVASRQTSDPVVGAGVSVPAPLPSLSSQEPTQPLTAPSATPVTRATPVPAVPTAVDLAQQTIDGKPLARDGWAVSDILLRFRARTGTDVALIPEVELAKADQPYRRTPTTQGAPILAKDGWIDAQIPLKDLAPGQYRWQVRFQDVETKHVSAWSTFADGKTAFGVLGHAPSIQNLTLTGAKHTVDGVVAAGQTDQVVLHWTVATDQPLALDHLVFGSDHQEKAPPALPANSVVLPPDAQSLPVAHLTDGLWYLHLWAVDPAGQISSPATIAVSIMRTPPELSNIIYRTWATNPLYQTVPIRFTLSHAATLDLSILPDASETPLRTYHLTHQPADREISLSWDGKDSRGHVVPPGSYRFLIDGTDAAGNQVRALYNGITITNKVIKVSLSKQSLTASDGPEVFLTMLVTTGGQALPTRAGQFEILDKAMPFVFHSPYPKGSPFWFADVQANYAMLFDPRDANFIHDAPWRTIYGPGTNGPGIPGQAYTGSHGCVESPTSAMARLYAWTPLGTPGIVTP